MKLTRSDIREYVVFLACGAANTLITYGFYALFLSFLSYKISYSLAYVGGIVISYYLNSRLVFKEPLSLSKLLQYPLVYVVQYLLGIIVLYISIDLFHISKWLAPLLVIAISLPVTYLVSKFIIKGPAQFSFRGRKDEN